MTLRFIVGRAGTGKTHLCLQEIKSCLQEGVGSARILLVPEQATYQMEKTLLEYCSIGGTMDTQVLSFQRLAWRVLQETGGGLQPIIDDLGKSLILRLLLAEHGDELLAFKRVLAKPGFVAKLRESIAEFKIYSVTPEKLAEALAQLTEQGSEEFRQKLADLHLLYQAYEDYIKEHYLDGDDYLALLAEKLHKAPLLEEAEIWLDGFFSYTPRELEVIRELLIKAKQVNICLTMDPSRLKEKLTETELFYPTWATYQRIMQLAAEVNCPLTETTVLGFNACHRFSCQPQLAALEAYLAGDQKEESLSVGNLMLVAAGSRRLELEGVAREIIRLCREEGYHYHDIGILLRNLESYEHLLPIVLGQYEIPYFTDGKRPLLHHPLLDLLRGALEVVEKGWHYEPVFRYLKTDLVPLSRQETDLLENYCLAHGIRGGRWVDGKPWTFRREVSFNYQGDGSREPTREEAAFQRRINKARSKAAAGLHRFELKAKAGSKALDYVRALYRLLEELAVNKRLEYWAQKAAESGHLEEAQLHSQVWNKFVGLLDQLVEVLGEKDLSLQQFIAVLESGLENIEMGLIPPCLDQVLIGSVDRSRHPALKAVFLIGVNDGVLPARHFEQRLLSEEERDILGRLDLALAPAGNRLLFEEQFLIYHALTRASEYFWLSYSLSDDEGKALSPSLLIASLSQWLTKTGQSSSLTVLRPEESGAWPADFPTHAVPALNELAQVLQHVKKGGQANPRWLALYNWYQRQEKWREPLHSIIQALLEKNSQEKLSPDKSRLLYGVSLRGTGRSYLTTSVSRLEKHRECPFAHFVNYGLRLKEREEFKLKSPDLGQFFHTALELVYLRLEEEGLGLRELNTQEIKALVAKVVGQIIPQLQNELLMSTARYRYLARKLQNIVVRAMLTLQEHDKRGTFRPIGVEVSFGPRGQLPGLQLTLRDGSIVELQGRIDRVDAAPAAQGSYLRVVDYKSGAPNISLGEIYYGLKLQLMAYLNIVLQNADQLVHQEVRPGGVLYFRIQDPFITGSGPLPSAEIESQLLKEQRMKGYILKDLEAVRAMDTTIAKASELVPVSLSAAGELSEKANSLLSEQQFTSLCLHLEKVLADISEEILSGNIEIKPYRYKNRDGCKFCLYGAVCRFDRQIPGHRFRSFVAKEPEEIWQDLGLPGGEHHE